MKKTTTIKAATLLLLLPLPPQPSTILIAATFLLLPVATIGKAIMSYTIDDDDDIWYDGVDSAEYNPHVRKSSANPSIDSNDDYADEDYAKPSTNPGINSDEDYAKPSANPSIDRDEDYAKPPATNPSINSDKDYANMSDLDISDDDVIQTRRLVGRKSNKGGPELPQKGSVADHVYEEVVKARKRYNDQQRYNMARDSGSTSTEVTAECTGICNDQFRPMSTVKEASIEGRPHLPSE